MTRAVAGKISAWIRRTRGAAGVLALCLASAPAVAGPTSGFEASPAWPLDALAGAIRANADSLGVAPTLPTLQSFADGIGRRLFLATAPEWLQRSEFKWSADADEHLSFATRSVQPLYRTGAEAVLMDGRLVRGREDGLDQTGASVGLGLRRLLANDRLLIGTDTFLDHNWPRPYERGSLGGEIGATALSLRGDLYRPLADGGAGSLPAARTAGYDLRLRLQLPYMPAVAASFETSTRGAGAVDGVDGKGRVALRFQPLPFLSLEGEAARRNGDTTSYGVMLRFALPLGHRRFDSNLPLLDDRPFRLDSMRGRVLDPVRPEMTMGVIHAAAKEAE